MSAPKFKVGDRVRVIAVDSISDCDVGQTGTVRNLDDCPWVHFDTPTRFECEVKPFGIPAFFADIPNEDHLELIDSNEGATP